MIKIAHIADIHYRGTLTRHAEYKEIFKVFFKQLKEQNVDHVFVAGDIFHTKTSGISPEFIEQISWWIKELSKSVKKSVHMILGNHDGNLINSARQDAISPIIEALNIPNVFLYKYSGVYKFDEGYNWCHFSIFDKDWDKVKPVPGEVNIACYHGSVVGASSDTGWNLNHGLDVKFFEKYDLVFLGDIHRMQHLSYRDLELEIDESLLEDYLNNGWEIVK